MRLLLSLLLLAPLAACATDATLGKSPFATDLEPSVKPGINESFLDPQLDVTEFTERFEIESREVFAERHALMAALNLKPGQRVADIGSGTGLFLEFLSAGVGSDGEVVAVEISPPFVEHLDERIRSLGLANTRAHLGGERGVGLPANSIDVAWICDTYHHFEYPRTVMGSIGRALAPGGEVVIVDFHKIPGVTRDWLMEHVRANQIQVIAEMNRFGFDLVEALEGPELVENYALRFVERTP